MGWTGVSLEDENEAFAPESAAMMIHAQHKISRGDQHVRSAAPILAGGISLL
jgi:hypothetical protein